MASGDQQGRLIKFLDSLELDYTPVVPDELTRYIIQQSGVACARSTGEDKNKEKTTLDERTLRLFSLAGQKFLTDLIDEACVVQQNRMMAPAKVQSQEGYYTKEKKAVLLTEDLAVAMKEFGLKLYRPSVFHSSHGR